MADGKVVISALLDTNPILKGIKTIKGSFGGLGSVVKSLGAAIGIAFSVGAIVRFGKESVQAASDLSNALQGLQSIVEGQGRSFSTAQSFIEEYTKDGLIPATNAINAYKNLALRGYDDSQIRQVMVALKDASAFGRQASYSMGEAVQTATEGLKNENSILVDNAGVTKNVAKMWEEYAASIGTTSNNLTQEQKIQAEVNGILEESKYQVGDAAKVAGTFSGQLQQMSFNFNNLKIAVGNAITPIIQSFLPAVNTAITALTRFANAIAAVVGALFGKASLQTGALASQNESVASSASAGAAAEEELADATKAAGQAAKKSLASFDELNVLQSNSGGGGGSGGAASAGGGGSAISVTAEAQVEDTISPKLQAIIERIRGMIEDVKTFGEQVATAFQPSLSAWSEAFASLGPSVEDARIRIGEALSGLWNNSLAPFASYITFEWIPGIANTFSETFAPIFADVMPVAMDTWTTDFENGCMLVSELCAMLQGSFEGVKTVFSDMCASISENWDTYGGELLQGFSEFKEGLWETWWYIYDNIIEPVVTACGEMFGWLWDQHLKPLWDNIVEFVMSVGSNILALWNGFLKPVIDWIVTVLAPLIVSVINIIAGAVGVIVAVVSDVVGGVLTFLDGLIQFITGIFTLDWKKAWNGIVKIFEGLFKAISGIVKGVINAIIWALNALISAIYSAIAGVVNGLGSIVKTVGNMIGQDWGFSVPTTAPKIPYLAQGAVIPANKPFYAVLGDQKHGTNIEAPLETIQEAVAAVMEDYVSSNLAGQEAIVGILREILEAVLGVQIGDDVIGQACDRYRRKMAVVNGGLT